MRKILSDVTETNLLGDNLVQVRTIVWCKIEAETSGTYKTDYIGVSTYIDNNKGISAYFSRKLISLNKKSPLSKIDLKYQIKTSLQMAVKSYLLHPSRSKQIQGVITWFDQNSGKGFVKCIKTKQQYSIFACNFIGKKTWYPETACMYAKKGAIVIFDLADMGDYITATNIQGDTHFDSEKWNSLDQSKLAFKCDDNGNATNGLFS